VIGVQDFKNRKLNPRYRITGRRTHNPQTQIILKLQIPTSICWVELNLEEAPILLKGVLQKS